MRPKGANKNAIRRGGASPARDITAAAIYRVIRRGGIYAARAAIPVNRPNGQTARRGGVTPPYRAIKNGTQFVKKALFRVVM